MDTQFAPQTENPAPAVAKSSWSWGAFMFDPIFMIATGRSWWLLIYILSLVPLLNIIVIIVLKIYFGLKGREMVMTSTEFSNDDEKKGFLKGIDKAGKLLFIIGLIAIVVGFVVGFGGAMSLFRFN